MSIFEGPEPGLALEADRAATDRPGPLPLGLDLGVYSEMDVALDPKRQALWCFMRPAGAPSFSRALLRDLGAVHGLVHRLHAEAGPNTPNPVRFCIVGSDVPGVFNFGGDLTLFLECIRTGDAERLREYAHACVEAVYCCSYGVEVPCLSIALVEGDALGGGLEAAMAFHILVAERGTRLGLPEAMFNLFPCMGAYSFLARRVGPMRAEKLILSGKTYTAEEFHEMGIVDVLAEKGDGRAAVHRFIAEHENRHALLWAMQKVRRRVSPLTKQELFDVTDIWVETAMKLGPDELRRMEFLRVAQTRMRERVGA